MQAFNTSRRASDTNALTLFTSQNRNSSQADQKRLRSGSLFDVKDQACEYPTCGETDASKSDQEEYKVPHSNKLSLEERVHEHALAAAAVAKTFPSNGKHSTTFEMIEFMEGDNTPDKIVRVHVIADRFSACIPCRRRKIRCLPSDEMPRPKTGTCGTCLRRGKTCVWTDDSHGKAPEKKQSKKKLAGLEDGKEVDKHNKMTKRKRSSVKQEPEEYHLQTYSKLHGMNEVRRNKQYDYPDTAHLLDPPKFENVNWAGMQYPPFYNASDVSPFLSPTTTISQSTLLALEKQGYPHGSSGALSANYSGSPNSTLHSPNFQTTWATAPVLKSEPLGSQNEASIHHYQQYQDQSHYFSHTFERSYPASSVQVPTNVTGNMEMMNGTLTPNIVTSNTSPESMPSSYFSPSLDTPHRSPNAHLNLHGQNVHQITMPGMTRSHSFHCVSGMGQKEMSEEVLNGHATMMREMPFDCNTFKGYSQDANTPFDNVHSDTANANLFMKESGQESNVCDPANDRHYISSFIPPSPHHLSISASGTEIPSCSSSLPSPSIPNGQLIGGTEYSHSTNEVNIVIPSEKSNMFQRTVDWTNSDMLPY